MHLYRTKSIHFQNLIQDYKSPLFHNPVSLEIPEPELYEILQKSISLWNKVRSR